MKFDNWLKVYGDINFRGACPLEGAEQMTFFNYIRDKYPQLAKTATHIKNEGKRTMNQAMRDKANGLAAGAADIIIPGSPAFVCELKRQDHTKCRFQPGQEEYLQIAHQNGAFVCVALGHKAAIEALEVWLCTLTIAVGSI